jgi:hypothetical protein
MTDMVLERIFDEPLMPHDVIAMGDESDDCFGLHKVEWHQSFLAAGGRRLLCWFSGPDAESVRVALRQSGVGPHEIWRTTVHDAADESAPDWRQANVVVERQWPEPIALDDIQAIEDAGAHCLETWNVRFARTFFSTDRTRMACLYLAPDAEAVRMAQRQAGMPMEKVWAFSPVRDLTS